MGIAVSLRFVTTCRMKTIRIRNTVLRAGHLSAFPNADHVLGLGLTCRQMTTNDGRSAAPKVAPERDPLGMINGEGVITGTVVSAAVIAAAAGHLERDTDRSPPVRHC